MRMLVPLTSMMRHKFNGSVSLVPIRWALDPRSHLIKIKWSRRTMSHRLSLLPGLSAKTLFTCPLKPLTTLSGPKTFSTGKKSNPLKSVLESCSPAISSSYTKAISCLATVSFSRVRSLWMKVTWQAKSIWPESSNYKISPTRNRARTTSQFTWELKSLKSRISLKSKPIRLTPTHCKSPSPGMSFRCLTKSYVSSSTQITIRCGASTCGQFGTRQSTKNLSPRRQFTSFTCWCSWPQSSSVPCWASSARVRVHSKWSSHTWTWSSHRFLPPCQHCWVWV